MHQPGGRRPVSGSDGSGCPHRPPCPGCPRFGEPGIAPAARLLLDALAHAHGLPPVGVESAGITGFRHRARLAIRGRAGAPKLGMFAAGSHRVVTIPSCVIHNSLINNISGLVRRLLAQAGLSCYSERTGLGLARYLQVVVERHSRSAQVVLVGNSLTSEPFAAFFAALREQAGRDLHSLWYSAQCGRGNAILGPGFEAIAGPASVVEHFGGAAIHYPPGAFGQGNLEVAGQIIAALRAWVPPGARVAEFYAGVGAIGLSLLGQLGELSLNELNPHSLQGLALGVADLPPHLQARVRVLPGTAAGTWEAARGADVVIADPPRKGLDTGLLAGLQRTPPRMFLYVSCGLESFLRDAAALAAGRRMRLTGLTAFNLMPYTEHVETLARFEAC